MFLDFLIVIFLASALQSSENPLQKPDLAAMLQSDEALNTFLIAYWPPHEKNWAQTLFVRGNGLVILQAVPVRPMAVADIPTCTAQISTEQLKDIIRLLLAKRFLDLPERHFLFITAAQGSDEIQFDSIGISDGQAKIRRTFGIGKFAGKPESIPEEFAAVEDRLKEIWHTEFPPNSKECRFSPAVAF